MVTLLGNFAVAKDRTSADSAAGANARSARGAGHWLRSTESCPISTSASIRDALRIFDGHARKHQLLDLSGPQNPVRNGKLDTRIDAEQLGVVFESAAAATEWPWRARMAIMSVR